MPERIEGLFVGWRVLITLQNGEERNVWFYNSRSNGSICSKYAGANKFQYFSIFKPLDGDAEPQEGWSINDIPNSKAVKIDGKWTIL